MQKKKDHIRAAQNCLVSGLSLSHIRNGALGVEAGGHEALQRGDVELPLPRFGRADHGPELK